MVTSTCPFCGIGCQLELSRADGMLSSAQAAPDVEINDGQLCVRGRFCLPETTHHHARARKPMLRRGAYFRVASWDEALGEVTERLAEVAPDELLMLVSSDLPNEGLFAAQRLVRAGLGLRRAWTRPPAPTCRAVRRCGLASSRCRSRSRRWPRPMR